ncbi:MAG: outer membrane protein assembly factor BamA [Acidobacteriota bacterium]
MSKYIKDSETVPGKKQLLFFLVFGVLMISFGFAWEDKSSTEPTLVKGISIRIEGTSGGEEYLDLIPLKEGDPFSLKNISGSIKQLYQTGLFSDIKVFQQDPGYLIFSVAPMRYVRNIIFLGVKDIPRKKLEDNLYALEEGAPFFRKKLDKAREEIEELLRKEGFFEPKVQILADEDPESFKLNIIIKIDSFQRYRLEKIEFQGNVILPQSDLKKTMIAKEGDFYVPSRVKKDLERLRDLFISMNFRRVEIDIQNVGFNKEKGTVSLVIFIQPHEQIKIQVEGVDIPQELLQPIWEARIFEEWGLAEGEAKIIQYLRKKGYLFTSVSSRLEYQGDNLLVIYQVNPGTKFKIQDSRFHGVEYFSEQRLKSELGIGSDLPFLVEIEGDRIFRLPREIEMLYQTHGFPSAQVHLNFEREGNKIWPIYFVEEGKQERVDKVFFQEASFFTPGQLASEILSKENEAFFKPNLQKDVEKLETLYLNHGFRGTKVEAQAEEIGEDLYSVRFQIKEGRRVRIQKIIITGNKITRDNTIYREIKITEGDFASYEKIQETKRRLENLGIFTEVRTEEIPVTDDEINLLINLREGERNYISLGLGVETRNEPRSFEIWNNVIRPRGTAEFIRNNIFGTAAQLSLVGQVSLKETRGVFSWEQPYFFGIPLQTYFNAWLEREERKSYAFDRRGVSLTAIRNLSKPEDLVILSTLRYARTTLYKLYVAESEIDRQHYPFSTTSISGSFIWDRRNDPFNPKKGFFLSSVLEWAYPLFEAESNFLKTFSKVQYYYPLYTRLTLGTTVRLGLGRGRIPIHERFFAGGSNSFRGVEFDDLGPKDPDSGNPVGGKALFLLNFELSWPFLQSLPDLNAAIFYDMGDVFSKRSQFNPLDFQHALGFGFRYRTPLGPVRFELGWNLRVPEGEKRLHGFITIGNVF